MPAADLDLENDPRLPFDPIKKSHILHCSCHSWYPRYRTLTPKTRLIPLSPAFVSYLHADGIQLPPEGEAGDEEFESDFLASGSVAMRSGAESSDGEVDDEASEPDEAEYDPSADWPEIHSSIMSTIAELGGKVVPKLNWSAPKDATWINATNSMDCRTPNDIYLLLKSSDFVTHDLEHAFDGCVSDDGDEDEDIPLNINADEGDPLRPTTSGDKPLGLTLPTLPRIPYTLSLRKSFALNPSVEFRTFVRNRRILAISQRSVNYFDFLFPLAPHLQSLITTFFEKNLQNTFPDDNYVFDVYIPDPYRKVWLIDFNPWAPRTDPLLFSWLELLTMEKPQTLARGAELTNGFTDIRHVAGENGEEEEEEEADEELFQPEFRLIKKDDPEGYSFNTPQYSAHKLPKDVVEASQLGEGPLREWADQWKEVLNRGG